MTKPARLSTLFIALLALSGIWSNAQGPPESMKWYAFQAKQRGLKKIEAAYPMTPTLPMSLDFLSKHSLVVDAKVVSSALDSSDGVDVYTWFKVRVLSNAGKPIARNVPADLRRSQAVSVPSSLGPLDEDELLIREHGGTAVCDGIIVTIPVINRLDIGKRYLIFLEPISDVGSVNADEHINDKDFRVSGRSRPVLLDESGSIVHPVGLWDSAQATALDTSRNVLDYVRQSLPWTPADEGSK